MLLFCSFILVFVFFSILIGWNFCIIYYVFGNLYYNIRDVGYLYVFINKLMNKKKFKYFNNIVWKREYVF